MSRPPTERKAARPPVQVIVRSDATMRGARAALVVRRAESLGAVTGLRPALARFEREDFDDV